MKHLRTDLLCFLGKLAVITLFVCLPALDGLAQSKSATGQKSLLQSDKPIEIASDRMVVDQKNRTIVFEGHVVVHQGDLTISGNRLTVYAVPKSVLNKEHLVEQIDRIEMVGDVKVTQQDKLATAGKAVFYNKEQKIVLADHPQIIQGKDRVSGELITLYIQDERSVIEGSKQNPVRAVLHPKSGK